MLQLNAPIHVPIPPPGATTGVHAENSEVSCVKRFQVNWRLNDSHAVWTDLHIVSFWKSETEAWHGTIQFHMHNAYIVQRNEDSIFVQ